MRLATLILGDLTALYASLCATLLIRYKTNFYSNVHLHLVPFSIIFAIWIIVFYISGLYDLKRLRNNIEFVKTLFLALAVNGAIAISFFYISASIGIAPKTNLLIFIVIFTAVEILWRREWNKIASAAIPKRNILVIKNGDISKEIVSFINKNPQLGYKISYQVKASSLNKVGGADKWKSLLAKENIDIIIAPLYFKKNSKIAKIFYNLLSCGVEIYDLPYFYEMIFKKIPLNEISEEWFLEKITEQHKFYDNIKRAFEFLFALALFIILIPIEILISILIVATSKGPAIYKQARVGAGGREFILYKFRTMKRDAEKRGAKWAKPNDDRTTYIGRVLRYSHLDELPQLINVIKGELSFVGPRPERPEFTEILRQKIPYYDIRHIIKPGITGWAQINYKYGASIKDSYEKLQYDIYYIKNRSMILDLAIIIKTIKTLFINQK